MFYTAIYTFINKQREDYKRFVREGKGPLVQRNHRIKLLEDIGVDLDPLNLL